MLVEGLGSLDNRLASVDDLVMELEKDLDHDREVGRGGVCLLNSYDHRWH